MTTNRSLFKHSPNVIIYDERKVQNEQFNMLMKMVEENPSILLKGKPWMMCDADGDIMNIYYLDFGAIPLKKDTNVVNMENEKFKIAKHALATKNHESTYFKNFKLL